MPNQRPGEQPAEQPEGELPPGVKLVRTLEGHEGIVYSVAFDPAGRVMASASGDHTVKLWDVATGALLRTLEGHTDHVMSVALDPLGLTLASGSVDHTVRLWEVATGRPLHTLEGSRGVVKSVAFDPAGRVVASGGGDRTVKLWDVATGRLLRALEGHKRYVAGIAFDPAGGTLASASGDHTVKLWDVATGALLRTLEGHSDHVLGVAFDALGLTLASASHDNTVKHWEVATGRLLHTLEGHTRRVNAVTFSVDGRLLASESSDGTLRLWSCETWGTVAVIQEPPESNMWRLGLAFHPASPMLVSSSSKPGAPEGETYRLIHFWGLDMDVLLGEAPEAGPAVKAVHHTTAKIVLVGDSGVGKSALGWHLAHGEFKEQAATHGQQFWALTQLDRVRADGTECEAILWDLAGQPDYRLIHALFLDDVDLALVVFDASDSRDPLHGAEFWLEQLKPRRAAPQSEANRGTSGRRKILVGARADRGEPALTVKELKAFCRKHGIAGYVGTSAKAGWGLAKLIGRMRELINWEEKPAIVTTVTFKRIKDYVLKLKENLKEQTVIVSGPELRGQLGRTDAAWRFTDEEMMTAVGHLENYGYVKRLRTSKGEDRVLLAPELLNNLAASFVLEARRNRKGLGSLEERRLMKGGYAFPELKKLSRAERDILADSVTLLFLEHNICFRETNPFNGQSYLVFPELMNLKKPLDDKQPTTDGADYTVGGAVENVYASLVVLLGYTGMFKRKNQWRDQARYKMADGSVCGFRREKSREGELELVLYFSADVEEAGRKVFEGLFESFLARRDVTVLRREPVACPNGHTLNRAVVRERLRAEKEIAHCDECGRPAQLPKDREPIGLTQEERRKVEEEQRTADQRTRFEQAAFQVMSFVRERKIKAPECFISYAWGDPKSERWVEHCLARDLQKAGVNVVLDRWVNNRPGQSVSRFLSRIPYSDIIIPVGTPLYFQKFENDVSSAGSVGAAEVALISQRLMGTEEEKKTVMPLLLAGEKKTSLPPLMWDLVCRDFRPGQNYFTTAFDFILDIYGIAHNDEAVADPRERLRDPE